MLVKTRQNLRQSPNFSCIKGTTLHILSLEFVAVQKLYTHINTSKAKSLPTSNGHVKPLKPYANRMEFI